MSRLRAWFVVLALGGYACVGEDPQNATPAADAGSSSGNPDGGAAAPKIVTFTAEPTKLPYGGGDVKLSFAVDGATSASIDNGVGDVAGKSSADTKITKATAFTLTATNASGSVTATVKVDVEETVAVQGKIVAGGQPLVGASVLVIGQPATTTSAVGTFTVTGVKPPYDLAIGVGNPVAVTLYKGLTRVDPTLVAFGDSGPPSATLRELQETSGTVSGGGPYGNPFPSVSVSGANRVRGSATTNSAGFFSIAQGGIVEPLSWRGPTPMVATFHASADIGGQGYYGKVENVALAENGNTGSVNIAMNMVSLSDFACTVNGPASLDSGIAAIDGGVRFTALGGGYAKPIPGSGGFPRSGTVKLHNVAGSTFYLEALYNVLQGSADQSFARKAVAAGTASITVDLAAVPQPTTPADAATGVSASTPFTFAALAGGIQRITLYATANPTITVITKDSTATLPDLAPFGAAFPKNTLYEWRLWGYAPLASLDDAALADTLDVPDGSLPPLNDVRITAAKPRTFTTAP